MWPVCLSHDIYIQLESACPDKQNSSLSFNLQARIAMLWRFKVLKVDKLKDNRLAIFKPANGFFWM